MNNGAMVFTGIAAAAGTALAGYSVYKIKKLEKENEDLVRTFSEKMDMSVAEVKAASDIDISEKLIEAAVKQAAKEQVSDVAKDVRKDVADELARDVLVAVSDLKGDYRDEVRKALENKAKKVTIDDIKKEVIEKTTAESRAYIRSEMDTITRDYRKQIDSLTQIYNNINTALGKEGK